MNRSADKPEFSPLNWTSWNTRFVLFTGKGGVGKTTVASGASVALADQGLSVLLVSTDPASNLSDVFQTETGEQPVSAPGVRGLQLVDLDPQAAAEAYRERAIAPYRAAIPPSELAALEEQLAGACTVEVAAFDAFSRLLADPETTQKYDHIVFDTAPTGHTLRLLALPAAWSRYLAANPEETTCLGPLAGLQGQRPVYERAVTVLGDADAATLVLVSRPDDTALTEAARAGSELGDLGLTDHRLVINGVLMQPLAGDDVAESYSRRQQYALLRMPDQLRGVETALVPLVSFDLVGVDALRQLIRGHTERLSRLPASSSAAFARMPGLDDLVDAIAQEGPGVTLVTGKGGVGKTSIAIRVAAGLARRGLPVHLATTDPAGLLPKPGGVDLPESVTVSHIDPEEETRQYAAERRGSRRDTNSDQQEVLEEDLTSPCTTEVAVFRAFSRLLGLGRRQHVVIDTAPTGHTLLLLDVTGAFHRQIMHDTSINPKRITTPLMRLQDPHYSRVVLVTLPESTPVAEASDLQDDLRRAGIEPFGWVLNACLSGSGTADAVLSARARLELPHFARVSATLARRVWVAPWEPGH